MNIRPRTIISSYYKQGMRNVSFEMSIKRQQMTYFKKQNLLENVSKKIVPQGNKECIYLFSDTLKLISWTKEKTKQN
jgi:hypothetical protein